jgi:hypothetical protein
MHNLDALADQPGTIDTRIALVKRYLRINLT